MEYLFTITFALSMAFFLFEYIKTEFLRKKITVFVSRLNMSLPEMLWAEFNHCPYCKGFWTGLITIIVMSFISYISFSFSFLIVGSFTTAILNYIIHRH